MPGGEMIGLRVQSWVRRGRCGLVAAGWLVASAGVAQSTSPTTTATASLSDSHDCTQVDLRAPPNELRTRAEQVKLLEQTLWHEISRFDPCPTPGGEGQGVGDDADAGAGVANGGGNGSGERGVTSLPTDGIQGGEASIDQQTAAAEVANTTLPTPPPTPNTIPPPSSDNNGKLPEDIPPADNDDIIAQQFRQAALDATDPKVQAELWNEYRRYKGLPAKE